MAFEHHEHHYFFSKSFEVYVPYVKEGMKVIDRGTVLYEKKEYALLACKCSDTIKKEIRDESSN